MDVVLAVDSFEWQAVGNALDEIPALITPVASAADPRHVFVLAFGEEFAISPVRVEREKHGKTVAEDAEVDFKDGEEGNGIGCFLHNVRRVSSVISHACVDAAGGAGIWILTGDVQKSR